jgi:hypothetical protein
MKTTLNKIRAHSPCRDGWEKLLRGLGKTAADDEPLWLDAVIDHNGIDDALWCLRAVDGCDREIRLFAVWCARRVQHLMVDPRSVAALDVAERYARGEASDEELSAAEEEAAEAAEAAESWAESWAARSAARSSAAAAARWAASAAATARWAVHRKAAAARDTERDAQADELRRVCSEMR